MADHDHLTVWSYTDPATGDVRWWSWQCDGCDAPPPQPCSFRGYASALDAVEAMREHVRSVSA